MQRFMALSVNWIYCYTEAYFILLILGCSLILAIDSSHPFLFWNCSDKGNPRGSEDVKNLEIFWMNDTIIEFDSSL